MKLLAAVLVALFAVSSVFAPVIYASALPDYKNSGKLDYTYACDNGQNTLRRYIDRDWIVVDIQTVAGDVFVALGDDDGEKFFMKLSGASEMQNVTHEVWDENLKAKAPAVFYSMHSGGQSDCAKR